MRKEIKIPIEIYEKLRKIFTSEEILTLFELSNETNIRKCFETPLIVTEDGVEIFNDNQNLFWLDWSLGKNGFKNPSILKYSLKFCPIDQPKYKVFTSKENAIIYHEEHLAHFSWDDFESAYEAIAPLHSPLYINLIRELKKRI